MLRHKGTEDTEYNQEIVDRFYFCSL